MNAKLRQDKAKAGKKVIDSSARCITCNKSCSMSGLCMKPWPEFNVPKRKGVTHDGEDDQKSS